MFNLRKLAVSCIFVLLAIGLFLTCDDPNSPFTNNLGEKVVVEPPTINVVFPVNGSYITSERDPVTGEIVDPVVMFEGRARAYIKVEKVEVYVFEDKENGQPERKWTDKGIRLSGDLKNKRWTYEFDPNNFNNYEYDFKEKRWGDKITPQDGPINMLFRVFDSTGKPVESVPLNYTIKNRPSIIKMGSPSMTKIANPSEVSEVQWNGEIRGTIIDRRGIRPGYPQIKIWPAGLDEPGDDDPEWGWASLFLQVCDDTQKGTDTVPAGPGIYADRSKMRVVYLSTFSFHLAKFDIEIEHPDPLNPNPDSALRKIVYRIDGKGKHETFAPNSFYNFRIRTSDTSSDPLKDYIPTNGGPFIKGFFPPSGFSLSSDGDSFQPRTDDSGKIQPVKIKINKNDSKPEVKINNNDIDEAVLNAKPNIYITESPSYKIAANDNLNIATVLFRLRLLLSYVEGDIFGADLTWSHDDNGPAPGAANLPYSLVDRYGSPVTFPCSEAYLVFTADSATYKNIFKTSTKPYTLSLSLQMDTDPTSERPQPFTYLVYMDGENPNVGIRSVRGAVANPAGADAGWGGMISKEPCIVNGNIQVVVDRSDDFSIMTHRKDNDFSMGIPQPPEEGYSMVKWIVEEENPFEADGTTPRAGTVLANLKKYQENPSEYYPDFFYSIGETQTSGWVRRPVAGSTITEDRSNHFKFNTFKPDGNNNLWDGKELWLYVIAQDRVYNLGFALQKIKVDDDTDKPVINIRNLSLENTAGQDITGPNGDMLQFPNGGLDVNVGLTNSGTTVVRSMTGNWSSTKPRNNILAKRQSIDLNFTDDDGIEIIRDINGEITAIPGVTIKLTVIAPVTDKKLQGKPLTVTIDPAKVLKGTKKSLSGMLTPQIMADALYGPPLNPSDENTLDDGIYKIEFSVKDNIKDKVEIPSGYRDLSYPHDLVTESAEASAVYHFAVSSDAPKVTITYPKNNEYGGAKPIIIEGEAKSRLDIKTLLIIFKPDVITPNLSQDSIPILVPLKMVGTTSDENGFYNYTWEYGRGLSAGGVVFQPSSAAISSDRNFEVEAYDRIGNVSVEKCTVRIDSEPPEVTILFYPPRQLETETEGSVTTTYMYGKVSFTVKAVEPNGFLEKDGYSGIKWWVVEGTPPASPAPPHPPAWNDAPVVYTKQPGSPLPDSATTWTGGGNFLLTQGSAGLYTWIIDTRYLKNDTTYTLYAGAIDLAGNAGYAHQEFKVDWKRDYPEIEAVSLDPQENDVKGQDPVISGTVSDRDNFSTASDDGKDFLKNAYVAIRFPKTNANGTPVKDSKPAATDWDEWIPINISDKYSSSKGGIDSSQAILYKFRASNYTGTPAGSRAALYFKVDGVKYYQIKVTDEAVGPTDAEKTTGAKWYGKNPDILMQNNTLYPNYAYVPHNSVSIVFPEDTTAPITAPNMDPPDSYSFIVDGTPPVIFFDKFDPTKETKLPDGTAIQHPNYSPIMPTFSTVELLIDALSGTIQENKLSAFNMSYTVNKVTFRKAILDSPKEDDGKPKQYTWNLAEALTDTEKADLKARFDSAAQGLQNILFEATDEVPLTRRVTYNFAKDTQGPEINFNNIARSIKRDNLSPSFNPSYPVISASPVWPAWPSDWRYGGTEWQSWDKTTWKDIIENWPSEYAFKTTAQINAQLKAEHEREPSTVTVEPPVIEGNFSDLYSSVRITVPADTKTYFYYRFRDPKDISKALDISDITPPGADDLDISKVTLTYNATLGNNPDLTKYSWLAGPWIKKEIEKSPVDSAGKPTQNEKEANWKISLTKESGFSGTDGLNMVDIWVADSAGNISDIYNVRFYVDRAPPVLGGYDGTYASGASDPVSGITFLEGTKEDFIVANVNGLTDPKIPGKLPEVERVFSADGSGTPTDMAFILTGTVSDFNFSGLTMTIGQEGFGYTVTSTATLKSDGTFDYKDDDTTSPSRLKLYKLAAGMTDGTPVWVWAFTVLKKDIVGLRAAAKTGDIDASDSARRYIRVTASDKAGKKVGPLDWFFFLDTKKPKLEYTNLNTGTDTKASSFEDNKLKLSGLVEDDTRIRDVQFMIGRWDYATNKWTWYSGSGTTWTDTMPAPPTNWPSAFAENTTRQTSMNWAIDQATLNAAGATKFPANLFDNEGYYRLDLYVTDFSLGGGNPHNTTTPPDPTFNDANYNSGAGTRSGRVFYIDKEDPTLRWGWFDRGANGQWTAVSDDPHNPNSTTYFRNEGGQAKFSFTAGDGNTIKEWSVKVVDNETQDTILNENVTDQTNKNWEAGSASGTTITSTPIPIPSQAIPATDANKLSTIAIDPQKLIVAPFMTKDGLADSTATNTSALDVVLKKLPTYTITITVKDGAGRTSSISKQFTLDNTPPRFIQNNFSPTSFEYKDATAPAADKPVSAPGYTPEITTRSYSYDAVTGRMNIRGSTTDNSNQIRQISYYVISNADLAAVPTPKYITDNKLWRYSGGTGDNSPIIASGTTTLMEIDQGTFAWRIMVPKTSMFINDAEGLKYVQKTTTGGTTIGETTAVAGTYRDITITNETTVASPSETVPYLTFPDLNNTLTPTQPGEPNNPKRIYGGEDVGLITVFVRAEDMAGNVAYDVLKYWIWPEGDRPIVTAINTPNAAAPDADRYLNGSIRLSGMAKDNERVKNVWFRVFPANNGVITGAPYTNLKIPEWDDDWNAIPGSNQDPGENDTTATFTSGGYLGARRATDLMGTYTGGWYMANGGNSPEVSWYAYINTNGELEPKPGDPDPTKKEFIVEVRAQDVTYDDKNDIWTVYNNTYRGMASVPMKTNAWVVSDLPTFNDPRIATVTSEAAEAPTPKLWQKLDDISIRERSSYKVTVKHELGISAIRWQPTLWDRTLNSGSGGFQANPSLDSFNLVTLTDGQSVYLTPDGKGYTTGTTLTATSLLDAGTTAMALRVVRSKPITGTSYFEEYDVFVDLRADKLLERMILDDPKYGTYEMEPGETGYDKSEANRGRAGQVRNSVRYPVYLSASDISKATPLTARGDALLPVDNLAPYGMYTLNRKPAGTAVTIGGEAGDKGPVNGIARVVMWFQRKGGDYVSWHHQAPKPETTLDAVTGPFKVNNNDGPDWWNTITVKTSATDPNGVIGYNVSKPYIPNTPDGATGGDYAIVIDTNSPSSAVARWGHKLPMGFADGGIGKLWYVEINSYGIESGPVDLHYVVIDKAGNAKYYTTRLVIMNNVAIIDRIKLGTDIRHSMSVTANTSSLRGEKIDDKADLTASQWPILDTIRKAVPLGGVANDIKDDVKKGISDWVYSSSMGADKIIDFNVRNNLFALRVETTKAPVDKSRTFRVEYITGATLLENTVKPDGTADKTQLETIKAGNMYMVNNPSTAKWGMFGADGDGPWPRGYAFIATVSGSDLDATAKGNIGAGSVWELTTAAASTIAANPPADNKSVSAEFLYGSGAFGTGAGQIRNYSHQTDAAPDKTFPPPAPNADYTTWTAWKAQNQIPDDQSLFIIRVFDGLEDDYFGDFTIIRVRVNNDDNTKPFAQLYDLNPKTEGAERQNIAQVGNSTANELTRSISPMFIGEGVNSNRTKGGLWNNDLKTVVGIEKPGHIEPRQITYPASAAPFDKYQHSLSSEQMGGADTPANAIITKPFADPRGFFTRDTVSGKVVLRGYVEDDQRIQRVDLSLGTQTVNILQFQASSGTAGQPGYGTLGNTDSLSANYSPPRTGLLSAANNNVYFTDSIDAYRHRVEWAYIWDTETASNGDVQVRVIAYNRRATNTDSNTTANTGGAKTPSDIMNAATTTGDTARKVHSDRSLENRPNTTPFNPGFPEGLYEYNQIIINLRPYITGFLRNKTQFAHDTRSRQGWYMFARGETAVIMGFNMGTGNISLPGAANITTSGVGAGAIGSYGIPAVNDNRYRQFTVGANAATGSGVVTYSTAVNTGADRKQTGGRPDFIQPWNKEYSPARDGTELWDDFTQVHIWQSNDTTGDNGGRFASTDRWVILNPAMSIDPTNGTLYESHNESGSGNVNNTGTTRTTPITRTTTNSGGGISNEYVVMQFVDPIFFSDVYRSPGSGNQGAGTWVASSIIGRSGTLQEWRALGGVFVSGPGGTSHERAGGGTAGSSQPGSQFNTNIYNVEGTWYNASTQSSGVVNPPTTDQFMNPHVVTSYTLNGNETVEHIHVSYFDDKDGSIKYRYNRRGSPGTINGQAQNAQWINNNIAKMWTNLDGGLDGEDVEQTFYTAGNVGTGNINANTRVVRYNNNIDGTKTARGNINAGKHNSIAVTSEGYPVVAYYDQTNQRLKLAVSRSASPILASNWIIRDFVIPEDDPSSFGTGEFVSMRIDTKKTPNVVHIAAMNTSKRLVYVSGDLYPTADTPGTYGKQQNDTDANNVLRNVKVQVVDSVGNVGRWCALSLDRDGNPWISYMDESYVGARDGAKVAFLNKTTFYKGVAGGAYFPNEYKDLYGKSLEGWETMHVPTLHRVENPVEGPGREHGRLGMECWPTMTLPNATNNRIWSGAVSYLSQDAEGNGAAMDRYRVAYYVK